MGSRASLNHIYRTVWNQALGAMVAVAEVASGRGKSSGSGAASAGRANLLESSAARIGLSAFAVACAWGSIAGTAQANPTGGFAIHGQATQTSSNNQLLVTTQNGAGTNHSAINWQSFSIPAGSSTYFQQPTVSSTVINRVVTSTPSLIFGTLGSNGNVVLVNQSGITVGAGALVDTAGFTASALRMTDADAIAGRLRFGDGTVPVGGVSVQGSILARSGDVVLIGANVDTTQSALVQAPNGSTVLAAGRQIEITGRGLEGISMLVRAPTDSAVNLGTLNGDAVGIFAGTLKTAGSIAVTAVSAEGGKVFLKAADTTEIGGSVSAKALNGLGGKVHATADKVVVKAGANMDVSGQNGGGEALIGGGYQGKYARLANARRTLVEAGANINADAIRTGKGGTVVVWSDEATRYLGHITARGGAAGGNGGLAEVSGKQYLDFRGTADLRAVAGRDGTLLLDPNNLTIGFVDDIEGNGSGYGADFFSGDVLSSGLYPGANSQISASQVESLLANGNLSLEATNNITVSSSIASYGSLARTLTLKSTGGDINVNAPIYGENLNVSLIAGSTGAGDDINVTSTIETGGGNINMTATHGSITVAGLDTTYYQGNGGNAVLFASAIGTTNNYGDAGNVTLSAADNVQLNSHIRAYGGSVGDNGAYGSLVSAGRGGNVSITSVSGSVLQGFLSQSAYAAPVVIDVSGGDAGAVNGLFGNGGSAGNVTITAGDSGGASLVGLIFAEGGSAGPGGSTGTGGAISVNVAGDLALAGLIRSNNSVSLTALGDLFQIDYDSCGDSCSDPSFIATTATPTGGLTDVRLSGATVSLQGVTAAGEIEIVVSDGDYAIDGSILTSNSLKVSVSNGSITQTNAISAGLLTTRSSGSTLLTMENTVSALKSEVTGAGDLVFRNHTVNAPSPLNIVSASVKGGNIDIDNFGELTSTGLISARDGAVTLTAHSPITIGTGGVLAGGSILLAALTPNGTSNITVNGAMASTAGGISVQAYNNFIQNSNLSAAFAIDVAAGGDVTFGPGAFSVGNPVSYLVNGQAYIPPWIASTLSGGPTSFVDDFLGQFETALNSQNFDVDDPLGLRERDKEGVVVEGEICAR